MGNFQYTAFGSILSRATSRRHQVDRLFFSLDRQDRALTVQAAIFLKWSIERAGVGVYSDEGGREARKIAIFLACSCLSSNYHKTTATYFPNLPGCELHLQLSALHVNRQRSLAMCLAAFA